MLKLINYKLDNQEYIMQYSVRFNFSHRAESRISLYSFSRNVFNVLLSCMYVKFRGMHTSPVRVEFFGTAGWGIPCSSFLVLVLP